MAKYEKNRSTRRSTPRHPIAMASTAKPPDPMSCALAEILLPEPAHGVRSCGMCRRREPGQRHGCGGSVPGVAGGRRRLEGSYSRPGARAGTVCGWACRGLGDTVRSGGAGLSVRGRLDYCGVRWLFQGCCSGRRVGHWAAIAWREGGFRKCS
jgi:hypothetical protein